MATIVISPLVLAVLVVKPTVALNILIFAVQEVFFTRLLTYNHSQKC